MRRGRKAGPRKIHPDTISPAVWVSEKGDFSFLACAKRWLRLGPVTGGPFEKEGGITAEWFIHGAAIRMPPELGILLGFRINQGIWRRTPPEDHGISRRCAQVALAEAWHGVNVTIDSATMSAYLSCDGEGWRKHKNGVRARNMYAAMLWDWWERDGTPLETRAEILTQSNLPCTASQLAKFAEDRGI